MTKQLPGNYYEFLLNLVKTKSALFDSPMHGQRHWRTVERNGLYLARFTGADPKVISCFSIFHDCMRVNENIDPKHGPRGARFALENRRHLNLSEEQFEKLEIACKGHTYGRKSTCTTVATCWDADRLDIARVGITPRAKYLFSEEAKRIADEGDFDVLGQEQGLVGNTQAWCNNFS